MNRQAIQAYYTTPEDQTEKIIMVKIKRNRKTKRTILAICSFLIFEISSPIPNNTPIKKKTHDVAKKAIQIVSNIYYPPNTFLRYSSFVSFPIFKSACSDKFSLLKL